MYVSQSIYTSTTSICLLLFGMQDTVYTMINSDSIIQNFKLVSIFMGYNTAALLNLKN